MPRPKPTGPSSTRTFGAIFEVPGPDQGAYVGGRRGDRGGRPGTPSHLRPRGGVCGRHGDSRAPGTVSAADPYHERARAGERGDPPPGTGHLASRSGMRSSGRWAPCCPRFTNRGRRGPGISTGRITPRGARSGPARPNRSGGRDALRSSNEGGEFTADLGLDPKLKLMRYCL
jgi:hypothetical protein